MKIKLKLWLEKNNKPVFGAGKARILKEVSRTGSLNKAAKNLKMSYRHLWGHVKDMEQRLNQPLLRKRQGGEKGGGAELTAQAVRLLERYARVDEKVRAFADRQFKKIFGFFILLVMPVLFAFCQDAAQPSENTLRLATTTSTYETGLLDYIIPSFEKQNNLKVHIISVGTGKAIKLGENGDVDVLLVHDRPSEDKFIVDGWGTKRYDVMYNDFILVGPKDDPAKVKGSADAVQALTKISQAQSTFISRGDDSGTDKREKLFWKNAAITPSGDWYLSAGQGMNATLRMADEKNAYCLTDSGSWLALKDQLRLTIVLENAKGLLNPYGAIPVNPAKHPKTKYDLAMKFVKWLISPECQDRIEAYKKDGFALFRKNAVDPLQ